MSKWIIRIALATFVLWLVVGIIDLARHDWVQASLALSAGALSALTAILLHYGK